MNTDKSLWRLNPRWGYLALPLVGLVAAADCVMGEEVSLSILYLAPVALAVWARGRRFGVLASVCSAGAWYAVDPATGQYWSGGIALWTAGVRLGFYLIVTFLLAAVRAGKEGLEETVRQRTRELEQALADLQAEVRRRAAADEGRLQAQSEVVQASEHEQRRIGQDLHDSIQGNLVGLAMMLDTLKNQVGRRTHQFDVRIDELSRVVGETIEQTRGLAASLCPVDLDRDGLCRALRKLAETTTSLFRLPCEFHDGGVAGEVDEEVASHLYYISREAVSNALKHAGAKRIVIRLGQANDRLTLSVEDDGVGIPMHSVPLEGMGLRTMFYRASSVGGRLDVHRGPGRGTVVECYVPARAPAEPPTGPTGPPVV